MAIFSNDKIMSIIMLVTIIIITLLLESYSSVVRMEAFKSKKSKNKSKNKTPSQTPSQTPMQTPSQTPMQTPTQGKTVNVVGEMNLRL
jgi:hypothetical protein